MKIIGITGGIGSGKSFVADVAAGYFKILHISTDAIATAQMKKGGISFKGVVDEFGKMCDNLIMDDGELNRPALASLVFSDRKLLEKLNSITHPNVINEVNRIVEFEKSRGYYDAVLIESAIIIESGIADDCDAVWYVHAPLLCREERLRRTRGYSDEKIKSILDDQLDEKAFIDRADTFIENGDDVTVDNLVCQIKRALEALAAKR